MNSRTLSLLFLIAIVIFSSGCIGGQDSEKDLVKEGNHLIYSTSGYGNTTYTFFNETENTIKVREVSEGTLDFYTLYKDNLTTLDDEDFLVGAPNRYTENRTEREKIRQIMKEGGTASIYEGSEKVLEVTRGGKINFKGLEAYELAFESEPVNYTNIVRAESPYILLNSSSSRGRGLSLLEIERNVEINMTEYRNQDRLNGEVESNIKASATELEFSAVYSTENGEGEKRISFEIRNSGERDVKPENFRVAYRPDGNSEYKQYEELDSMWKTGDSTCDILGGVLKPSGALQCHTGLKFPGPEREVGIRIEATDFDYEEEYICSPVTEDSITC